MEHSTENHFTHGEREADAQNNEVYVPKPFLELFVKASGIDNRSIGACLFCQEFWMELYALYELDLIRVEVKTVNVNSELFKRSFLGALPPVLVELEKNLTYSDNREIERRIFHIAKEFDVLLFEKDVVVEKKIESLYRSIFITMLTRGHESYPTRNPNLHPLLLQVEESRVRWFGHVLRMPPEKRRQNFKIFLKAKIDYDRDHPNEDVKQIPHLVQPAYNKLIEQLGNIDKLLEQRGTRYLISSSMTMYDCELMPRLHHIRIAGEYLCDTEIPHNLVYLWNYLMTAYRTAAFIESCPHDQSIIYHYKEQLNLTRKSRESLQALTKTLEVPQDVLAQIQRLGLDQK
ncbi:unnamed protein product [Soboliphyme baturini]|uniref:F-box domain-containing protein n=1 Tax=Soboliphyme baturini TaxID=241478 RepID=A0A183IN43_9BILA|nr:unnamed protein product [Soboliphyme baturini]